MICPQIRTDIAAVITDEGEQAASSVEEALAQIESAVDAAESDASEEISSPSQPLPTPPAPSPPPLPPALPFSLSRRISTFGSGFPSRGRSDEELLCDAVLSMLRRPGDEQQDQAEEKR